MSGDERISAYLDGELGDDERRRFLADLEADPALRDDVTAIAAVRDRLSSSVVEPPAGTRFEPAGTTPSRPDVTEVVEPPAGTTPSHTDVTEVIEPLPATTPSRTDGAEVVDLGARRRRATRVLAVAAAVVMVAFVAFGAGIPGTDVVPPVEALALRHGDMAEGGLDGAYSEAETDEMVGMGPAMDGMPLTAAYAYDEWTQLVYGEGDHMVSVFRADGELGSMDPDPDAEEMELESGMATHLTTADSEIVVVENDGVVFTVVGGSSDFDTVVELASSVPDAERGTLESLRRWLGSWR